MCDQGWFAGAQSPRGKAFREPDEDRRKYMHLTNFCVARNKDPDHAFSCEGPTGTPYIWDVAHYRRHLHERFGFDAWRERLWPQIRRVVYSSLCVAGSFLGQVRSNCFQVLGYDLLVTRDLGVWMCEVNGAPDLSASFPMKLQQAEPLFDGILRRVLPDESSSVDPEPAPASESIGGFEELATIAVGT